MCGSLQLPCVRIESDFAVVVQAIRKGKSDNWRLFYLVNECLHSFLPGVYIEHVYRQKNLLADRLTAWAHKHKARRDIFRIEDCPPMVRTAYVADKMGLWVFRC